MPWPMPCTEMDLDLARSHHGERWGRLHRPNSAMGEYAMHRKHVQPTDQIQVFETSRAIKKILNSAPKKQAGTTAGSSSAEAVWNHPPGAAFTPRPVELVRGQSQSPGEKGDPELVHLPPPKALGLHGAGFVRPPLQDQAWIGATEGSRIKAHSITLCQTKAFNMPCRC